jgi:hypothetical protein
MEIGLVEVGIVVGSVVCESCGGSWGSGILRCRTLCFGFLDGEL